MSFTSLREKEEGRASKLNYISVSKSRQQLEFNPFSSLPQKTGCVSFPTPATVAVPLLWVSRLSCVFLFAYCLVDVSRASENKGNVSNCGGFHLVDALSWQPSWTGVVSYKMYALAPTSFWDGGGGGVEVRQQRESKRFFFFFSPLPWPGEQL